MPEETSIVFGDLDQGDRLNRRWFAAGVARPSSTRVAAKRIISSPYRSQISSFVTENLVADAPSVPLQFVDMDVRTLVCSSLASDGLPAAARAVGGLMRGRSQ